MNAPRLSRSLKGICDLICPSSIDIEMLLSRVLTVSSNRFSGVRTGTGDIALGAYRRTFSSGPRHHWCERRRRAFLTCPKGYVSQRAADR